jgi:deazaflavin-dependent oxidoreductase (nitroreductase family)
MTDGIDIQQFNSQLIERFRASDGVGEVGPVRFDHLVLLTTTGRRTGRKHTVPLGYTEDADGNLLLFASANAAPRDPEWYRNIEADPRVTVEITGKQWDTEAEILSGAPRDDAYRRWIEMAPHVADHEQKTGRKIPMVRVRLPESDR